MTIFAFANNAGSTLAGAISTTATTINLASGTGILFPTLSAGQQFTLTLISATISTQKEIVYVTAISGDALTVVRAQEGTVAQAFNAGDSAKHMLTANSLANFPQLDTLAGYVTTAAFNASIVSVSSLITALNYWAVLSAAGNWTCPAGVFWVEVVVTAGGGGAAGCAANTGGGCGAAGGTVIGRRAVVPGVSYAYSVAAGGLGGAIGNNAGSGGGNSSIFDIVADGGTPGTNNGTNGAGGVGGSSLSSEAGDLLIPGGAGSDGMLGGALFAGIGGASYWGGGGRASVGVSSAQVAITFGSGGGASYSTAGAGAAGAPGVIVIRAV